MDFVLISIAVGFLESLRSRQQNYLTYAINLRALTIRGDQSSSFRTGEVWRVLERILSIGLTKTEILWAGALLWGGASFESQGNRMVSDDVRATMS